MQRQAIKSFPFSVDVSTNAGILVNNSASLNPTNVVALEAWFTCTPSNPLVLFDNSQSGVTNSYFLSVGTNGKLSWFAQIGGVGKNLLNVGFVRFYGTNFVSAFYDGANINICLNGELVGTLAATGAMGTNSGQLRIGQYWNTGVASIGKIARPRIYNRVYTLKDHQDRYFFDRDDAAMRSGIVLDMPMNEGLGTSVADVSGFGNNGTFSRAVWSFDSFNKPRREISTDTAARSLSFNGSTNSVALETDGPISGVLTAFTLEAMVNIGETAAIQTIYANTSVSLLHVHWQIGTNLTLNNSSYTDAGTGVHSGNKKLRPGIDYLLHLVYDGSRLIQYIDADFDQIGSSSGNVSATTVSSIGRGYAGARYLKGKITKFKFWNRGLSPSEIQKRLFTNNIDPGLATGLAGDWRFLDGSGSVLKDSAGSDDGTITGATWLGTNPFNQRGQATARTVASVRTVTT